MARVLSAQGKGGALGLLCEHQLLLRPAVGAGRGGGGRLDPPKRPSDLSTAHSQGRGWGRRVS